MPTGIVSFPPFKLDHGDKCLWHGQQRLPLSPKDYAVLCCLVQHPHRLVTHGQLLRAGWPTEVVEPGVLKVRLRRLRQMLGDTAGTPRFIESVRGHGYRFIGRITPEPGRASPAMVGRDTELAELQRLLDSAAGGDRQVIFITGEPGIGKTALMDAFVMSLRYAPVAGLRIARGQCVEHHGGSEAYLPVLEALGHLNSGGGDADLVPLLRRCAPTWLAQMPALIAETELETLKSKVFGAAQERMMREMAELLEAFTVERPLLLCFEDLQWADYSTLDLLRYLAQRRGLARLLLLATWRDVDVSVGHPLLGMKQELHARRQISEVALRFLTEHDVDAYLSARFNVGDDDVPAFMALARVVHDASSGNPLFMVNMVDDLVSQGKIIEVAEQWRFSVPLADIAPTVPDNLRHLLDRQIARLAAEHQRLLEAASIVGAEFPTAAVAALLDVAESNVEESCEQLARRGRLLRATTALALPNGDITGRYHFTHALYQKVLYERQSAARRARLHRVLGAWMMEAYGARAADIASELARHFELGHEPLRAVQFLAVAAQNALRRSANREAIDLLLRGIALLAELPADAERARRELELQVTLAVPLMMTRGSTSLEVRTAYRRARELCREVGETPLLFPVLVGLGRFSYGWNLSDDSKALREQLLRIAEDAAEPAHLLIAHMMLSGNAFFQGRFARARAHAEQGLAGYEPHRHRTLIYLYGDDPQVLCLCWAALADWYLGHADTARARIAQALRNAEELSHPYGIVFARFWSAFIQQGCGAPRLAQHHTEAVLTLTDAHDNPQFAAMGRIVHSWARADQESADVASAQLRLGLDALRATRQELGRPYFLALLADVHHRNGKVQEGLDVVDEALDIVEATGECMHHAELHRLRGELLLARQVDDDDGQQQAAACFLEAMAIARKQSARFLELRAATSLLRLRALQASSREQTSAELVEAITTTRVLVAAFTEGFDTADLKTASALLARWD